MTNDGMSRRSLLRTGMWGSCGALAGMSVLGQDSEAQAAQFGPPGELMITKVETFALSHKLSKAFGVSTALSDVRKTLLIKISTHGGLVGWGETIDLGGTRGAVEDQLKKVLVGKNALNHRQLWRELWGPNFGDGRAVGGVDIALHDLRGKALGLSIADMYGGRVRDNVMPYASGMNYFAGTAADHHFPSEAAELAKRGYRAMKMRTGRFGARHDLAVLTKVREAVGKDVRLLTDGNGAFTLPQAVKFGKELEQLDFYCFEEPLPQGLNYAGYEVLTESLDIAVAGGEALDSRISARDHIVKRSFDIIQPDVSLCGGIAEVLFIAEMARLWSVQCIPHCWSGAIGTAAALQVVSLLPNSNWGNVSDQPMLELDTSENPFREEIVAKPFTLQNGHLAVPTGPGLGIEVHEEVVKKYLVKT